MGKVVVMDQPYFNRDSELPSERRSGKTSAEQLQHQL